MADEEVIVEQDDAVAVVTINRPDVYNALNARTLRGIADAVKIAERQRSCRRDRHHRSGGAGLQRGRRSR